MRSFAQKGNPKFIESIEFIEFVKLPSLEKEGWQPLRLTGWLVLSSPPGQEGWQPFRLTGWLVLSSPPGQEGWQPLRLTGWFVPAVMGATRPHLSFY